MAAPSGVLNVDIALATTTIRCSRSAITKVDNMQVMQLVMKA